MLGFTHGLAGVACAAAIAATATAIGTPLAPAELAAEAPDLDLPTSRISHGTSALTAVRVLRPLALVITLPLVLLGAIVRSFGVKHRGPTHSLPGALASVSIVRAPAPCPWGSSTGSPNSPRSTPSERLSARRAPHRCAS
jgi:membrane-bound metal-dependent hydrolase YbcI (DUF457 family)